MKKTILLFLTISLLINFASKSQEVYNWKNVNLQGMGFITGVVGHPESPNEVYIRTDVGGAFKWDGNQFQPILNDKGINQNVESIMVNHSDHQKILVAVGHNVQGKIHLSTDQGITWQVSDINVYMGANGDWRHAGERLSFNGTTAYFGSRQDGLWKSNDGGLSWTQVPTNEVPIGQDGGITFTLIHPGNSLIAYAGVQGHGIYKTSDGGETWNLLPGGPAITSKPVSASISNSGVMYVTYMEKTNGGPGHIFKYAESGSLIDVTPTSGASTAYAGISVQQDNPNNVLAFVWNYGPQNGIQLSSDGGENWTPLHFNNGSQNYAGAKNVTEPSYYPSWSSWTNAGSILIDPSDPSRAWLTNGFGVYKTDNLYGTPAEWTAEMKNVEELVGLAIVAPPGNGAEIIALSADMVGFSPTNVDSVPDTKLTLDQFGVGSGADYSVSNPEIMAYVGSDQYGGYEPFTGISTDGGLTWSPFPTIPGNANNGNIAISSTDPSTMVWTSLSVSWSPKGENIPTYYTRDGGNTWLEANGAPLNILPLEQFWFGSQALTSDKVNGAKFYMYDRGKLYYSDDHGANWTQRYNGLPSWHKVMLKAYPNSEGELFFSIVNDGSELFHSQDGGLTWNQVDNVQNVMSYGFGKAMPGSSNATIFLAGTINSQEGIFRSDDKGVSWKLLASDGVEKSGINAIDGSMDEAGKVYVSATGRGFFMEK